jgi:hypothetical protein
MARNGSQGYPAMKSFRDNTACVGMDDDDDATDSKHDDDDKDDDVQSVLEPIAIASGASKTIFRIKWVAVGVLVGSAAILAASVYFYLSRGELRQFRRQHSSDSLKVLEAVGSSIDKTLGLLDDLAISLLSVARVTNQSWPFVTLPDFAVRMTKILPLTDAIVVNVLPIVKGSERKAWETYSLAHDDWVNEGMAVQEAWEGYYGPVVYDGIPNGIVHSDFENLPYNTRYVSGFMSAPSPLLVLIFEL